MDFSETIELGKVVGQKNAEGFVVNKKFVPLSIVYGAVKSVGRTEFYKAQGTGKELTATIVIWADEYHDENVLRHNMDVYNVERAYKDGDFIQLNCSTLSAIKGK